MFINVVYFVCVALISYVVGTINFSKIVAWKMRKKDITKVGSGNPGTMNMLRSFGLGLALMAFLGEVFKSGLLCLIFKLIFPQFGETIYFFSGLFVVLGYNFPVWSKFKGGKGVACIVGIFFFSSLWYVALGWFVLLAIAFLYIDYAFVMSFFYIGGMSIAYTIYVWLTAVPYAWLITTIIWVLAIMTVIKHKENIKRLVNGTEKKIGFKNKVKKFLFHKKGEFIIDEELVNNKPEEEIVVDEKSQHAQEAEQEKENIKTDDENIGKTEENSEKLSENSDDNVENLGEDIQEDNKNPQTQDAE